MTKPCPGPIPADNPEYNVPPGACDTHFHVLGPYDQFPLVEPRFYTPEEATPAEAAQRLHTMKITRGVVVQATVLGDDPAPLVHAVDALNSEGLQVKGVAGLPLDTTAERIASLTEKGICGQRITGLGKGPMKRDEVQAHADMIEGSGWHLDFLPVSGEEWNDLAPVLSNLPVPVVIDHLASKTFDIGGELDQPGFTTLLELISTGNVWVKISSAFRFEDAPYPRFSRFVKSLAEVRADRLLWGSDWPHVALWDRPMVNTTDLLDWMWEIGLDDATRRAILVDNPAKLYEFE